MAKRKFIGPRRPPKRRKMKRKIQKAKARKMRAKEVPRQFKYETVERIASMQGKKVLWVGQNMGIHTTEQMDMLFNEIEGGTANTTNGMMFCQNFDSVNRFDLEHKYYEKKFSQTYTLANNEPGTISVKIYLIQPKKDLLHGDNKILDSTSTTSGSLLNDMAAVGTANDALRAIFAGFADRIFGSSVRYTTNTGDQPIIAPGVGITADVQFIQNPDSFTQSKWGLSMPVNFSPFDSPYFKKLFKIVSVKKLQLAGGQVQKFSIGSYDKTHRLKDFFESLTQGATPTLTPNSHSLKQIYVMFEIQGQLGHTASASEAFDQTYATTTDFTGTSLTTDTPGWMAAALDIHISTEIVHWVDELALDRTKRFPYLGHGTIDNVDTVGTMPSITATEAYNPRTGGIQISSGLDNTAVATNP